MAGPVMINPRLNERMRPPIYRGAAGLWPPPHAPHQLPGAMTQLGPPLHEDPKTNAPALGHVPRHGGTLWQGPLPGPQTGKTQSHEGTPARKARSCRGTPAQDRGCPRGPGGGIAPSCPVSSRVEGPPLHHVQVGAGGGVGPPHLLQVLYKAAAAAEPPVADRATPLPNGRSSCR